MSETTRKRKKFAAWLIFLTFVGISAVANYLHGADALAGFLMAMAPIGFAATMAMLETIVVKVSWTSRLAMAVVATGSGVASYIGLYSLAREHHVSKPVAILLPLAFDGVVLASSLAIRSLSVAKVVGHDVQADLGMAKQEAVELDIDWSSPEELNKMANHVEAMAKEDEDMSKALANSLDTLDKIIEDDDIVAKEMANLDTDLAKALDTDLDMDTEAWTWAMKAKADGQTAGQIAEELAKRRGVSARTIRRSPWWTQAMKGIAPA